MSRITTLVLFLVTSCVPAQDLVISNARILDGTGGVIEQGSIVVSDGRIVSVSAGDPEARGVLEIDAQGRGNWEMAGAAEDAAAPAPAAGEMILPSIDNAVVRDATLVYRDGKTGETIQVSFSEMALRRTSAAVPLEIALEGAYNSVPFKAEGAVGLIRDMIGAAPYPVR